MVRRLSLTVLLPLALVLALFGPGPATADPGGTGHIYKCDRLSWTDDYYTISFSRIYTCSNGPMDGPSYINEFSTYTDRKTGWIAGECAWYAYYKKGWRDMTRVWNWCLTRPRLIY